MNSLFLKYIVYCDHTIYKEEESYKESQEPSKAARLWILFFIVQTGHVFSNGNELKYFS